MQYAELDCDGHRLTGKYFWRVDLVWFWDRVSSGLCGAHSAPIRPQAHAPAPASWVLRWLAHPGHESSVVDSLRSHHSWTPRGQVEENVHVSLLSETQEEGSHELSELFLFIQRLELGLLGFTTTITSLTADLPFGTRNHSWYLFEKANNLVTWLLS